VRSFIHRPEVTAHSCRSDRKTLYPSSLPVKLMGVVRRSFFRMSWLAVGTLTVNAMALGACSSGSPRASAEFCSLGKDAARWYIDFDDDEAVAALVEHPDLNDVDRAAVRAAVDDARAQTADGNGWSNDRMTAAINDICDLDLTPVTMVP
jgi:hypothetical protein